MFQEMLDTEDRVLEDFHINGAATVNDIAFQNRLSYPAALTSIWSLYLHGLIQNIGQADGESVYAITHLGRQVLPL